jgi:hypothetical protein
MTNLPFLKPKGPAMQRKYAGESRYAFDEPSELVEQALDELMHAIESRDHKKMMQAIEALIESVLAKEKGLKDASDSQ